jgi:hypothetical protein
MNIQEQLNQATQELKQNKFKEGKPFMLFDDTLPKEQFIYEYSDGKKFVCSFLNLHLIHHYQIH